MKGYEQHDQRYFAMLNDAVAIADIERLEGGQCGAAARYYHYLLKRDFPDCPIQFDIPSAWIANIEQNIEQLIEANTVINRNFASRPTDLNSALNDVINYINTQLKKTSKCCYLPSGWVGSPAGHFAVLKVRGLENGHVAFSVINHGAGMNYHQNVAKPGKKQRKLYQSDEYEVDLGSPIGRELVQQLINIQFMYPDQQDPQGMINGYNKGDLYGMLKLYGQEHPLIDKIEQKAVTPQREGSCTITNIHAEARDTLVDLGADLKARKRYHFVLKLRSILDGYEAYLNKNCERAVLEWGLNEFAVRVNKEFAHVLSPEEVIYCSQLHEKIQKKLNEDAKEDSIRKSASVPLPERVGKSNEAARSIPKLSDNTASRKAKQDEHRKSYVERQRYTITPGNVISVLDEHWGAEVYTFKYHLLMALPYASGHSTDPFWDNVTKLNIGTQFSKLFGSSNTRKDKNVSGILMKLADCCRGLGLKDNLKADALAGQRAFVMALIAYDIAAQVVTDDEYTPGLDDVYSELSFFNDPEIYFTVKRIVQNFEERAKGRKRVLTNSIDYESENDVTIQYLIKVRLNNDQRKALMKLLKLEQCSDQKLFLELMKLIEQHTGHPTHALREILSGELIDLMIIAGTAQSKGAFNCGYRFDSKTNGQYCFSRSHFQNEARRNKQGQTGVTSDLYKHMPDEFAPRNADQFYDSSQNTVYHPQSNLERMRGKFAISYSRKELCYPEDYTTLFPYQIYLSGSSKPDSVPWEVTDKTRHLLEEVDEQFRLIECTPHLQIARIFGWIMVNPTKLILPEVRSGLNELLFAYGRLDEALSTSFDVTIESMSECFSQLIATYQEEGLEVPEVINWVGELSYHMRRYIQVTESVYGMDVGSVSIPSFQDLFVSLMRSTDNGTVRRAAAQQLLLNGETMEKLSLEDCAQLLIAHMILNLGQVSLQYSEAWINLRAKFMHSIQTDPDEFVRVLTPMLVHFFQFSPYTVWALKSEELTNKNNDYWISLHAGALRKKYVKELKDRTDDLFKDNAELFKKLGLTVNNTRLFAEQQYTGTNNVVSSADGLWVFRLSGNGITNTIISAEQVISIEGQRQVYAYQFSSINFEQYQSPFESKADFGRYYQYWDIQLKDTVFFVRQSNSELAYLYDANKDSAVQLSFDQQGEWKRTGKVLVNVVKPQSAFEKQWAQRLSMLFGVENVRCIARLSQDQLTCKLESITHLKTGLQFNTDDEQRLIWSENPNYYLSNQCSLEVLHGLSTVLILVNKQEDPKHDTRKIIIPAFELDRSLKNYSFDFSNVVTTAGLCVTSFPYFVYTLDKQGELMGDSIESNMYLAILYRSLGEYKKALHYLARCHSYHNVTPETVTIAMQVMKHPMINPMGAAFDLKLDVYLQEHQKKWTNEVNQVQLSNDWIAWIKDTQLPLYENAYSLYKQGVSIFPTYMRLTSDELCLVSKQKIDSSQPSPTLTRTHFQPDKRLVSVSSLPYVSDRYVTLRNQSTPGREANWEAEVENIKNRFKTHYRADSKPFVDWRLFDERFKSSTSFAYLFTFFNELLADALSKDPSRVQRLRIKLFAVVMNEKEMAGYSEHLIALLNFASHYPQYFDGFVIPNFDQASDSPKDDMRAKLIHDVGVILLFKHHKELQFKSCNLITYPERTNDVPMQKSFPVDYTAQPVHFELGDINEEALCKHPLKIVADKVFDRKIDFVASVPFSLKESGLKDPTPLERRLINQYKKGHESNQRKEKVVYQIKKHVTLEDVKSQLLELQQGDLKRLTQMTRSLEDKANRSTSDRNVTTYHMLLSRASEQHLVITVGDLFTAFLRQDPLFLTNNNPFLSQDDIRELFTELADYALLSSRIAQVDKAIEDLSDKKDFAQMKAYELNLFAATLDKTRSYVIKDYPEFLVYEYATGRILREDQVATLINIINIIESDDSDNVHHALLQFAAGGGKTSVLIPILANRFARKHYLPVIFNTNELYGTGLVDIPKNMRESLGQHMEVLERELDHSWTESELEVLLKDLQRWRSEGKCLLIKPVTWHTLNIARKVAYINKDWLLARALDDVLDFFKTKTIKLEDESHIISDPLQICIKTFSKHVKPHNNELGLLMRFYDHLMGYEPGSQDIQQLAGIKTNQKQTISAENREILQVRLAEVISLEPFFEGLDKKNLIAYLTKPDKKRPKWLLDLNKSDPDKADLVVLSRAYIQTHLPHILTLQDYKDYGPSIHVGDLTVAPKHEGIGVTSHFADHSLVVALTIQMTEQRGLTPVQVDMLLDAVIKQHEEERLWNKNMNMPTEAEAWLSTFDPMGYGLSIAKIKLPKATDLRCKLSAAPAFVKHPAVVKKYLIEIALPQVAVPSERQTSTAAELQAGFDRSLMVSATPGLPELYPAILPRENCFMEEAFEAEVIDVLLSPENRQYVHLDTVKNPADFFNGLPSLMQASLTTLIDRGALLTDFDGQAVIEAYLGLDLRPTDTGVFFSKSHTHVKTTGKKTIDIPGTALLMETLKKLGKKPEEYLLFLFMDLSKTTGVDVKRPFDTRAGLTVGKGQTVTETIQAAMRQRQLLDDDAQSVTWIMFKSLYREMYPDAKEGTFDLRHVFYWMIKNESNELKSKIINRAYQGIEREITSIVWDKVGAELRNHLCRDHNELKHIQNMRPFDIYEQESSEAPTAIVLNDFKRMMFEKFKMNDNDKNLPIKNRERINKIIQEATDLIELLETPPKIQINNEVEQEMKMGQELKQEQKETLENTLKRNIDSATDFVFNLEKIHCDNVSDLFGKHLDPIAIPGCDAIKQHKLLFDQQHFAVLKPSNAVDAPKFDHLKPVDLILVKTSPSGTREFRACTAAEANYFSLLLDNTSLSPVDSAYAIVNVNGIVVHTSHNVSKKACKLWVKSADTQKILAYANFLNGYVSNPTVLSQLIAEQGWSKQEYETMANSILPMLVSKQRPNLLNHRPLYELCGWGKVKRNADDYVPTDVALIAPIKKEALRAAQTLEKPPGKLQRPIAHNERVLEGYLFNESPTPIKRVEPSPEVNRNKSSSSSNPF